MGKGEIARYEQFLLFPQCFQKACFPGASKGVIVWEWVNGILFYLKQTVYARLSMSDLYGGSRFDTRLLQTFLNPVFRLSSLMHMRKIPVVSGFEKKKVMSVLV